MEGTCAGTVKGIGNKNSTEVDGWRFNMFVLVSMDEGDIGIFDGN